MNPIGQNVAIVDRQTQTHNGLSIDVFASFQSITQFNDKLLQLGIKSESICFG